MQIKNLLNIKLTASKHHEATGMKSIYDVILRWSDMFGGTCCRRREAAVGGN